MHTPSQKKKILFVLMLLVTQGQFGVDLYLPSMPHIARDLLSSPFLIKLTIPYYLLGYGVSQLFYGPISDSIGRKPVLHFGLTIFLIGSLGCLFSQNAMMLIFFRIFQGLGIGATIINVRASMRDVYRGKQMAKVSSWLTTIWAITPIVAPVLGGYIQDYIGWRANFAMMFLYSGLIWLLIFFVLPETLVEEHKKTLHVFSIMGSYLRFFSNKVFLAFSLMSSLCYAYFISYATASPFLFQNQLNLSSVQYGWLILVIAFGMVLGSMICNRIIPYIKIVHITLIGTLCMIISTFILFLLSLIGFFNISLLLIPPFFGSIGGGMIFPNCTTGAIAPYKKSAGIAGACFGFIQMAVSFFFSFIVSHLSVKTALPLSIELLIISALIIILHFIFIQPHYIQEEEEEEILHHEVKPQELS